MFILAVVPFGIGMNPFLIKGQIHEELCLSELTPKYFPNRHIFAVNGLYS